MENFMKRVSAVQAELKAPKGQYNSFGKYKYRSCEDILEAVKPLLVKHGMVLTVSDRVAIIGERYYIEATAKLMDTDSDAVLQNTALAREADEKKGMDSSQVTGTASSYARKYALNGLLCIDDTKDADTDECANEMKNKPIPRCEECGKPIPQAVGKSGKMMSPEQVAMSTKKRCGRYLCLDCAKAESHESEN